MSFSAADDGHRFHCWVQSKEMGRQLVIKLVMHASIMLEPTKLKPRYDVSTSVGWMHI